MASRTVRTRTGQSLRPLKGGVIGAIDVGSSKIACLILKPHAPREGFDPKFKVLGFGFQASRGVRAGNVVDINAAEVSIRAAVEQAEEMAGLTLKEAFLAVSCGHPQSRTVKVEVPVSGNEIGESDLQLALSMGRTQIPANKRDVLHCMPGSYSIDGSRGIRNPVGMIGHSLGVNFHVVSAAAGPLRNLEACVGRCHLSVAGKAVAAYASGLSTLVADEIELGATVIDMGGGTTSIAVFTDGGLVFSDVLPVGGNHVTSDIARGISTSIAQAERLKTLFGSALSGPNDGREMITVQQIGEEDSDGEAQLPRSVLTGIIQPRIEETFEIVRDRLAEAGWSSISARRVVLTGGASQLNGAREIASRILSKQVRLGKPAQLSGGPELASSAAFSACAGIASWAAQRPRELENFSDDADAVELAYANSSASRGIVGLKRWFKENF
ncbi:MAG: cell division protein FtsA [Micropepsaceae bacterium]